MNKTITRRNSSMGKNLRKANYTQARKTIKELPVFVYGTLLPGHGNYEYFLEGHTLMEEVGTMQGKMYDNHGAYPVVDTKLEGTVKGMIMHIQPAKFQAVMESLDHLEGYQEGCTNNLYERVVVDVKSVSGSVVKCYTYSMGALFHECIDSLPEIASGDWDDFVRNTPKVHISGDLKFQSKQSVITSGAQALLNDEQISDLLTRHFSGDWGKSQDKKLNNRALKNGDDSMMSVFEVNGEDFWVYTEWDRSVTTILLPSEW